MPYTANPVWSFPPNWDRGVLETLEWKTEVLISENSDEQRICRRLTPRRYFEASFLIQNADRQLFSNLLLAAQSDEWVIPIWQDVSKLMAGSSAGTDTLNIDTVNREYVVGGLVMLRGKNSRSWEVAQIQAVNPTNLKLISNLEKTWRKGTIVYPMRKAILSPTIQAAKRTDTFFEVSTRFTVNDLNTYAPSQYFLKKYMQIPVCEAQPDESQDLTEDYRRNLSIFDSDISRPDIFDLAGRAQKSQSYRWTYRTREKYRHLKELLYYLRGRNKGVWLPTYMHDFTVISQPVGEFAGVTVQNVKYNDLGLKNLGYRHIRIELSNGAVGYREIFGGNNIDSEKELIVFDSPFYIPEDGTKITKISYMTLSRLDQDSIEVNHNTDVDGVTTVGVVFVGPIDASVVSDPTSKPYTVINADGLRVSAILIREGSIERPIDFAQVVGQPTQGTLTRTVFLKDFSQPGQEKIQTLGQPADGFLVTTFFPITFTQPGQDKLQTQGRPTNSTLTRVFYPVNYNNWPAEGITLGSVSLIGASVT